jgi:hypothetical protein
MSASMVKWIIKLFCNAEVTKILVKVYKVTPKYYLSWIFLS